MVETLRFWGWRCQRCGAIYEADDPNVGSTRWPICPEDQAWCERAEYTVEANGKVYQKLGCPDLPECREDERGCISMNRCSEAILRYAQALVKAV